MRVSVDQSTKKKIPSSKSTMLGDVRKNVTVNNNLIHIDFEWEKGKGLNAQVQNIKLDNQIHTIKGSYQETLDVLLEQEDPFFGTHYLNLFTQHYDAKSISWEGIKKMYKDTLKMLLIYKAFTGDGINNNVSEILILRNGNTVKVFSLQKILQKIINSDSKTFSVVTTQGDLGSLFKNKKVYADNNMAGANQRIANVLLQAHQRKVQASFNSLLLNNL